MILRKPYAFLIKKFRLIHLILSLIVGYLIYNTSDILKVYNTYISSKQVSDVTNAIGGLSRPFMYIALFIFIVSILIVGIVLKIKHKPIFLYVINTFITITVIALYSYAYSTLKIIELASVDIRVVRVIRDLLIILIALQSIQFITLFVRATGFDIKKFDFGSDLIGLQVTDEDREEVEVSIEVDSDVSKRKIVGSLRNFKYTFLENKLLFSILIMIVIIVVASFIIFKVINKAHVYDENEKFKTNHYSIIVKKSYFSSKNYDKKAISTSTKFLIVKLDVMALQTNQILNYGNIYAKIGNTRYYPSKEYNEYFTDVGNGYSGQKLNTEKYEKYIIVFAIPNEVDGDAKIVFGDDDNYTAVKLNTIDLDNASEKELEYKLNELSKLEDGVVGNFSLSINSYEISKEFVNTYDYCSSKTCYVGNYFVVANSLKNYDTTLIKLNTSYKNEETNVSLESLFENYGVIKYNVGNIEYETKVEFIYPKVKNKNDYYIEINSNINSAEHIEIDLNTRNTLLKYRLK